MNSSGSIQSLPVASPDKFDNEVHKLEQRIQANPRGYALRVGALAVLGYGYIGLVLALMLVLLLAVIDMVVLAPNVATIKLAIFLGAIAGGIAWAILKGLWVRLPTPQGLRLEPAAVPALFALIEDLRRRLDAPRFHEVLLNGAFSAGVTQIPRLGIFGWQKNYLLLGLPLLQGLSPDEFKAVLAHEFGHLSGNHARFGGWIYRLRCTWQRIFEEMAKQRQRGTFVLTKFIGWYWPKFNTHAFLLSRANEYQADACSAQFAGAANTASALIRINLLGAQLNDQFWPALYQRANHDPAPPADVFALSASGLRSPPDAAASTRWLRTAFLLPTTSRDTHPSLKDRLHALGQLPDGVQRGEFPTELEPVAGSNAAEVFLGDSLPALTGKLNGAWQESVAAHWQQRHQQVNQLKQQFAGLVHDESQTPTVELLWQKAELLLQLEGDEGALPLVNEILAVAPDHAAANFVRGRYDLGRDDPGGVAFIEQAMVTDEACVPAACEFLYGFYARTGRHENLHQVEVRLDAHRAVMQKALAERSTVTAKDNFAPHELTPEQLQHLHKIFAAEHEISEVHAARKVLAYIPDSPLFVLAVQIHVPWWKPRSSVTRQKLVERVLGKAHRLPGRTCILLVGRNLKRLGRKHLGRRIAEVPGSPIYTRTR